jgi:ubiquinone/menaquinone biosynthesis C-methylase UbiE
LASGYGAPGDAATLLARIADVERRPPPKETVEGLLATPFPTPDEARPYLGDWVGDVWMKDDQPRTGDKAFRIRIENGRVIGESVHADGPNGPWTQRWDYFRVTPNGFTYGVMNGMRPRGVVLFEGTVRGDTFTGESRFGGIDFRRPDGSPPPPLRFSFKRVRQQPVRGVSGGLPPRDEWQRVPDIIAALGGAAGKRVADIAAGTGYLTKPIAKAVGASGRVFAVEISDSALANLRDLARRETLGNIEVVAGTTSDPRLPADIDAAVILNSYHELADYKGMLAAIRRALRPGGVLVLVDNKAPAGWFPTRDEQASHHALESKFVEEELRAAGFEVVDRQDSFIVTPYAQWMIVARK